MRNKPEWAKGDGIKKACQRCGNDFIDYTKKGKWIHCFPCWEIKRNEYPLESKYQKCSRSDSKSRNLNRRVCLICDGEGCLDCNDGISELEAEQELFLGED